MAGVQDCSAFPSLYLEGLEAYLQEALNEDFQLILVAPFSEILGLRIFHLQQEGRKAGSRKRKPVL